MELVHHDGNAMFGKVESVINKMLEEEGRLQGEVEENDEYILRRTEEKVRKRQVSEGLILEKKSIISDGDEEETYKVQCYHEINKSEQRLRSIGSTLTSCLRGIEKLAGFLGIGAMELSLMENAHAEVAEDIQKHHSAIKELLGTAEACEKNVAEARSLQRSLVDREVDLKDRRKNLDVKIETTMKNHVGYMDALREAVATKQGIVSDVRNVECVLRELKRERNQLKIKETELAAAICSAVENLGEAVKSCRAHEENCKYREEKVKLCVSEETNLIAKIDSNIKDHQNCLAEMSNLDCEKDYLQSELEGLEDEYADVEAIHAQFEEECHLLRVFLDTKTRESEESHAVQAGLNQQQEILDNELTILESKLVELEDLMQKLNSSPALLGLESDILKQKISIIQEDKYRAQEDLYGVETDIVQWNNSITATSHMLQAQEDRTEEAQTALSSLEIEKLEISTKYSAAVDSFNVIQNESSLPDIRKNRKLLQTKLVEEKTLNEQTLSIIAEMQEEIPKLNSEIQYLVTVIENIQLEEIQRTKLLESSELQLEEEIRLLDTELETKRELLEKAQCSSENGILLLEQAKTQIKAISEKLNGLQQQELDEQKRLNDRKVDRYSSLKALKSTDGNLQVSVEDITTRLELSKIENQRSLAELEQLRTEELAMVESESVDLKSLAELKDRVQLLADQELLLKERTEQMHLTLGNRNAMASEYTQKTNSAQALLNSEIADEEHLKTELQNCRSGLLSLERSTALQLSLREDLSNNWDDVSKKQHEQEQNLKNLNIAQKRLKEVTERGLRLENQLAKVKADVNSEEKTFALVQEKNQTLKSVIEDTEKVAVKDQVLESEKQKLSQIKTQLRIFELRSAASTNRDLEWQRMSIVEKLASCKKKKEYRGIELTTLRQKLELKKAQTQQIQEDLKDMVFPLVSKNQGIAVKMYRAPSTKDAEKTESGEFFYRKESSMTKTSSRAPSEHMQSKGGPEKRDEIAHDSFKLPVSRKDSNGKAPVHGLQLPKMPLKSTLKRPAPINFTSSVKHTQKASSNAFIKDNGSKALKLSTPTNPYDFDDSDSAEDWSQFKAKEQAKAKRRNEENKTKAM